MTSGTFDLNRASTPPTLLDLLISLQVSLLYRFDLYLHDKVQCDSITHYTWLSMYVNMNNHVCLVFHVCHCYNLVTLAKSRGCFQLFYPVETCETCIAVVNQLHAKFYVSIIKAPNGGVGYAITIEV